MDNDEIYARFGISSKLAYGLIVQSILVICATIISIWGLFELKDQIFSIRYLTNIISILTCISLLVYSFYGFNAEKNQERFFITSVILFIILMIFGLFTSALQFNSPVNILGVISLISTIFFLHDYTKSYKSANFALLITLVLSVIIVIFNIMGGMPWFAAVKYIIIPFTIALTYFERVKRGKYQFKI